MTARFLTHASGNCAATRNILRSGLYLTNKKRQVGVLRRPNTLTKALTTSCWLKYFMVLLRGQPYREETRNFTDSSSQIQSCSRQTLNNDDKEVRPTHGATEIRLLLVLLSLLLLLRLNHLVSSALFSLVDMYKHSSGSK